MVFRINGQMDNPKMSRLMHKKDYYQLCLPGHDFIAVTIAILLAANLFSFSSLKGKLIQIRDIIYFRNQYNIDIHV